jgi:hypothetical protein
MVAKRSTRVRRGGHRGSGSLLGVDFAALCEVGRREGLVNVPCAESTLPWPTPAMQALLSEGRVALHRLAADLHQELVVPRIRVAMARQRVERASKAADRQAPTEGDDIALSELVTAEAALAAAEIRLSKVWDVFRQREAELRAATSARIQAVWAGNLEARDEAGRLLTAGLALPELEDEFPFEPEV